MADEPLPCPNCRRIIADLRREVATQKRLLEDAKSTMYRVADDLRRNPDYPVVYFAEPCVDGLNAAARKIHKHLGWK